MAETYLYPEWDVFFTKIFYHLDIKYSNRVIIKKFNMYKDDSRCIGIYRQFQLVVKKIIVYIWSFKYFTRSAKSAMNL